jgi:hypothetical protein
LSTWYPRRRSPDAKCKRLQRTNHKDRRAAWAPLTAFVVVPWNFQGAKRLARQFTFIFPLHCKVPRGHRWEWWANDFGVCVWTRHAGLPKWPTQAAEGGTSE